MLMVTAMISYKQRNIKRVCCAALSNAPDAARSVPAAPEPAAMAQPGTTAAAARSKPKVTSTSSRETQPNIRKRREKSLKFDRIQKRKSSQIERLTRIHSAYGKRSTVERPTRQAASHHLCNDSHASPTTASICISTTNPHRRHPAAGTPPKPRSKRHLLAACGKAPMT